jgi:NAD(P)-dependent dehydrogenase (short-subunit alcohol dehydrogenase family)
MSLLGKAFIVTGGASGIGKSTVRKLLGLSAQVHVIDIAGNIPTHQGLSGQLESYPGVNITSRKDVRAVFDRISAQKNVQLGGLAHCAGIVRPTQCSEEGDEFLRQLWDVNVLGTWNVNTEFHRSFTALHGNSGAKASANASIVNVGSMASVKGMPGIPGYVASKHAVLGLSRSFAQTWGSIGMRVNCIAPGAVNTPMIQMTQVVTEEDPSAAKYMGALKTLLEPDEVAETILFLLGDGSSSITGQLVEVNGGWP